MDWFMSRTSYYADFVIVPILCIVAAVAYYASGSDHIIKALGFAILGFTAWTLVEYVVHRWVFHRIYRKEHWAHHKIPEAFIGVKPWQTTGAFIIGYAVIIQLLGMAAGTGAYVGFLLSYLTYIMWHDQIHHSFVGIARPGNYWDRQARRHQIHHRTGKEVNFGIVSPMWDYVFGTFEEAL